MITALVHILLVLAVVGLIFYLLWWAISMLPLPAPVIQVVRVVLILILVLVLINLLLPLIGVSGLR